MVRSKVAFYNPAAGIRSFGEGDCATESRRQSAQTGPMSGPTDLSLLVLGDSPIGQWSTHGVLLFLTRA